MRAAAAALGGGTPDTSCAGAIPRQEYHDSPGLIDPRSTRRHLAVGQRQVRPPDPGDRSGRKFGAGTW